MATFRARHGRITATVRVAGRPSQSATFSCRSEANAWVKDIEAKLRTGQELLGGKGKRVTLAEVIKWYRETITAQKKGKDQEESKLNVILADPIAQMQMAKITEAVCDGYKRKRLATINPHTGKPLADATVLRELQLLSSLFKAARLNSEFQLSALRNPITEVPKPAESVWRTRRVEDNELELIFGQMGSLEAKVVIALAIELAARRSEVCLLRWEDIRFDKRTARLEDVKHPTQDGNVVIKPLSPKALALLRSWKDWQWGDTKNGRVFSMRPDSVTQAWIRGRDRVAVELPSAATLRLHDATRAEGISRLIDGGLSQPQVGAISGHKDWRMLQRYYRPRAEDLAKLLDEPVRSAKDAAG